MCNFSDRIYNDGYDNGFDNGFDTGFNNGFEDGFEDGVQQTRINAIKFMLSAGLNEEVILQQYSSELLELAKA